MAKLDHPGDLLRAYGLRTKKRLGQHFLSDPSLLQRIVDAAGVEEGSRVLEIGPGCGTLTLMLLKAGAAVTAVELDNDAHAFLRENLVPQFDALRLVHADALEVDLDALIDSPGWLAVANLPYNVATPILFRLLELHIERGGALPFRRLALMFQKEVAERICAEPGTRQYGALSLNVRLFATASVAFKVKPGAFSPPPAVDSGVVVLEPILGTAIPDLAERAAFREVVTASFAQRRKTIRNSMQSRYSTEQVEAWLAEAGIEPRVRAERLGFEEFRTLARVVSAAAV